MRYLTTALIATLCLALSGCGYNTIQTQDEAVKAAWSEVVNQYQRRADLIPNLVNTVKGFAAQEQAVLIGVTEARARATSIQVTPETASTIPRRSQKFQAAQGELTSALKSLLVVVERYPDLKSDQNFRDLQAQLEGTENRIAVARNRYIESVQAYNGTIRRFPVNLTAMIFGYDVKPNFTVENEAAIAQPPTVDFNTAPARPSPQPAADEKATVDLYRFSGASVNPLVGKGDRPLRGRGVARAASPPAGSDGAVTAAGAAARSRASPTSTGTLTAAERAGLEEKLAAFEARKGAQIAVLVVPTTQPEAIEQYSIRVVEAWKLGREKPDDGALLLVAMQDRALRIEVGRGLEGALTDLVANRIIDEIITPRFREGDFAGGITAGVDRMIAVVDGEPLPEPEQHWDGPQGLGGMLPILFFDRVRRLGHPARDLRPRSRLARDRRRRGRHRLVRHAALGLAVGVGVVALLLSLVLGFGNGGRWSSRPRHGGWTPAAGAAADSAGAAAGDSAAAAAVSVAAAPRGAGRRCVSAAAQTHVLDPLGHAPAFPAGSAASHRGAIAEPERRTPAKSASRSRRPWTCRSSGRHDAARARA